MTGRFGGKGDNQRQLMPNEFALIRKVFQTARLPPLHDIMIGDGSSATGTAWTASVFLFCVGFFFFGTDLSVSAPETLVHEMTHVWQYYNGSLTMAHAFKAQAWAATKDFFTSHGREEKHHFTDKLYSYNVTDGTWDDMGFEGQAQMVEDWYTMGMHTEGYRFVFVKNILWDGDESARSLTRAVIAMRSPSLPDTDVRDVKVGVREVRPALTDDVLIDLLKVRYSATDVVGYGRRVMKVEQ